MPSARAVDECRPIRATYNLVDSQDSSSTLSFGQFQILTSVQGPTSVQIRQELTDEASLNIQLTPLNGIPNLSYSSFSQDLIGIFKSSILLSHFPRSLLTISSQVLSKPKGKEKSFIIRNSKGKEVQDQVQEEEEGKSNVEIKQADDTIGEIFRSSNRCNDSSDPSSPPTPSEKALTINSIQLTLLNSGPVIGSKSTICAISCAVLRKFEIDHERSGNIGWRAGENETSKSDDESLVILIDPSPTEENLALSTHVFAFSFSGRKSGEQPSEKKSKRRRTNNHMEIDGMKLDQDLQIEDDEEDEEEETIGNGEKVELVFNESLGRVEMDLYEELLKKALIGCRQLYEFMRSEMERLHRLP